MSAGRGGGGRSILTSRGGGDAPLPQLLGVGERTEGKGGSGRWDAGAKLRCGRTAVARGNAGPGGARGRRSEAGERERARAGRWGLGGTRDQPGIGGRARAGGQRGRGQGRGEGERAGRRACVRPPLPWGSLASCVRTRAVPRRRLGVRSARARLGGAPVRCPLRRGRVGARSPRPGALQPLTWSELWGGRAAVSLFLL